MINELQLKLQVFQDTTLDLNLLTIISPNASGKSNFLDALIHITRLTKQNLSQAFEGHRGLP